MDGFLRDLVDFAENEISVVTDSGWLLTEIGAVDGEFLCARRNNSPDVRLLCTSACGVNIAAGTRSRVLRQAVSISLVRADYMMLIICGGLGTEIAAMPAFMFRRTENGGVFDVYVQEFERLWQGAAEYCDIHPASGS